MKTKEEIYRYFVKEYLKDSFPTEERTETAVSFYLSLQEEQDCVYLAMEEYAKQQESILLPSIDDAGVIAVNVVSNVRPKLTAQEEAIFIAGFQECVKYLSMQKLKK